MGHQRRLGMTKSPEIVFIDANVLFSAAIGSRVCRTILGLPSVDLLTSDYCLDEARRNLAVKAPPEALSWLPSAVESMLIVPTPPPMAWKMVAHHLSPTAASDAPVLASAVVAGARSLITGNTRDFGELMSTPVNGLPIVYTPRAFLLRGAASTRGV